MPWIRKTKKLSVWKSCFSAGSQVKTTRTTLTTAVWVIGKKPQTYPPDVPAVPRRGKAPPVHLFTGEGSDELWDEWLPIFKGAAEWNNWSDTECLLQLAGHLRGKARQEFLLLDPSNKSTYADAVSALSSKFNFANRSLAAQDFRHATQGSSESVSDYILRLEKVFRQAYGQDNMGSETRRMLLYAQLQEGLRYTLMKAPSVSGARDYSELCIAAKNEERRLSELAKRHQYLRDPSLDSTSYRSQKQSFTQHKVFR